MEQKPDSDRGAWLVRALLLTPVMLLAHFVALTCVVVFVARLAPILFALQYNSPRLAWLETCWFSGWLLAAVLYLFWGFLAISIVWEVLQREMT